MKQSKKEYDIFSAKWFGAHKIILKAKVKKVTNYTYLIETYALSYSKRRIEKCIMLIKHMN